MSAFNGTVKAVTATINKIDGKALRAAIQTAALHVIGHAMAYGHSPLANALDDRMGLNPMTKRLQPLVRDFLTVHGPFNFSTDTGFVFSKAKRDALNGKGKDGDGEEFDYEAFVLTAPMWDSPEAKQRKATVIDMIKAVNALIDRAKKKVPDGKVVSADVIPYLEAMLSKYHADVMLAKIKAEQKAADEAAKAKANTIDNGDAGTPALPQIEQV